MFSMAGLIYLSSASVCHFVRSFGSADGLRRPPMRPAGTHRRPLGYAPGVMARTAGRPASVCPPYYSLTEASSDRVNVIKNAKVSWN